MTTRGVGKLVRGALAAAVFAALTMNANAQVVRGSAMGGARASSGAAGAAASIPLPFSPERTGLPIPLQIRHIGGSSAYNAGVGWEMPLSFLQVRNDIVGRLPRADGLTAQRVLLSIGGAPIDLVSVDAQGTHWTPRDLTQSGELKREDSRWVYRSGDVTYVFEQPDALGSVDSSRFWLTEVRGPMSGANDNSVVKFTYSKNLVSSFPGVEAENNAGYEVLLDSIRYNFLPGSTESSCAKNVVEFEYVEALDNGGIARVYAPSPTSAYAQITKNILSSVVFRASDAGDSCGGNLVRDRQIDLVYDFDLLTGFPRVDRVDAKGRSGTGDTAMPLMKFKYGPQGGSLEFEPNGQHSLAPVQLPTGMAHSFSVVETSVRAAQRYDRLENDLIDTFNEAQTNPDTTDEALQQLAARVRNDDLGGTDMYLPEMTVQRTWGAFVDMTGDGRPDWVFRDNGQGPLKLAVNISHSTAVGFASPIDLFAQGNVDMTNIGDLPLHLATTVNYPGDDKGLISLTTTWVKLQDFNGDGRLDIIDTRQPGHKWVVWINTPSDLPQHGHHGEIPGDYVPGDAPIYWTRTEVDVTDAQTTLAASFGMADLEVSDFMMEPARMWPGGASRLPLETIFSGGVMSYYQSYMYDPTPYAGGANCDEDKTWHDACRWLDIGPFIMDDDDYSARTTSYSVVAHRFQDTNADGYIDMIFSPPRDAAFVSRRVEFPGSSDGAFFPTFTAPEAVCQTFGVPENGELIEPTSSCPYTDLEPWSLASTEDAPSHWRVIGTTPGPGGGVVHGPNPGEIMSFGERRGLDRNKFEPHAFILHNVAGAMLGAHGSGGAFRDTIVTLASTGCNGLEQTESGAESFNGVSIPRTAYQRCAVRDVSGDGLLDAVSVQSDADHVDPDHAVARLGDGAGFTGVSVEVPVESAKLSESESPYCLGPGRMHPAYLHDYDTAPQGPEYYSTGSAAFADVDGDGLIDGAGRMGTGAPDVGSMLTALPQLPESSSSPGASTPCEDTWKTTTILVDVNGDGRLDKARIVDGQLYVQQLRRSSGEADVGMLAHGRLVEVTDGYGVGTRYTYVNAKNEVSNLTSSMKHEVPFAEIVVGRSELVGEQPSVDPDIPQQEPTHYQYGNIGMRYSVTAERFVPTGYLWKGTLRGRTVDAGRVRGVMTVEFARDWGQTLTEEYMSESQRDLLLGTPSRTFTLEGEFHPDYMLQGSLSDRSDIRSIADSSFSTTVIENRTPEQTVQAADRSGDRCPNKVWPYGGTVTLDAQPTLQCVGRGMVTLVSSETRSGLFGEAASSDRVIVNRNTVEERDTRGRPTLVRDHRDVDDTSDDICHATTYATPDASSDFATVHPSYADSPSLFLVGRMNQLLDVVRETKVTDCAGRVFSKTAVDYDTVGTAEYVKGMPVRTVTYFEKEDGTLTDDSEALVSATVAYNDYGQPQSTSQLWEEGLSSLGGNPVVLGRETEITYDAFNLVPTSSSSIATDDEVAIVGTTAYDPISLRPVSYTDRDGVITRTYYDGYGRLRRTTVASPSYNNGAEYIVSATEYIGDTSADHTGRTVRSKEFPSWKLLNQYVTDPTSQPADEVWTDTKFDHLGQVKKMVHWNSGEEGYKLETGRTKYDSLGRPRYVQTRSSRGRYYFYPDYSTEATCSYEAYEQHSPAEYSKRRFQMPVDEPINGVSGYVHPEVWSHRHPSAGPASCEMVSYEPNGLKRITILPDTFFKGVTSPLPIAPAAARVDEFNARGELVETRLWDGGSTQLPDGSLVQYPVAQTAYSYDLGRLTTATSYRRPSVNTPLEGVARMMSYDGLGRLIQFEEPMTEPVQYVYDQIGQLVMTEQADQLGNPRRLGQRYDGLGRIAESGVLQSNAFALDTADATYTANTFHGAGVPGAGRLESAVRNGSPTVTTEYDVFGRAYKVSHALDETSSSKELVFDGLFRISQTIDRVNDNEQLDEVTNYTYHRNGQVQTITHGLAPSYVNVMTVNNRHYLMGLPQRITRGNGSVEDYFWSVGNYPTRLYSVSATLPGLGANKQRRSTILYHSGRADLVVGSREEILTGSTRDSRLETEYGYDGVDRLNSWKEQEQIGTGSLIDKKEEKYRFDGLGAVVYVVDVLNPQASLSVTASSDNPSRVCSWAQGDFTDLTLPIPTASDIGCTVQYDERGLVTQYEQPRTNAAISMTYTNAGEVATVTSGLKTSGYFYGATGNVAKRSYGNAAYAVLGSSQERPDGAGGRLIERSVSGGMKLRGVPGVGTTVYEGGGVIDSLLSAAGAEVQARSFSPFGVPSTINNTQPASSLNGTLMEGPGESVCGYNDTCNHRVYRVGSAIYDPYLGRVMK